MEIILKKDVEKLGEAGDLVEVKPGYGRNYLIPQGFAVLASNSNKKMWEENQRQAAHKAAKIKADAEAMAEKIGDALFTVKAKAGESGKIFGKVTTLQLADVLEEKGYKVDRRKISFDQEISSLGQYTATIQLHKEVKHTVNLEVVED